MNEYFADTLATTGLDESTNEVMAKQWYQGEDGDLKLKEEADPIKKIVECTEDNKKKFKHLKAGAGDIILQYVDENGIRTRSVDKDTGEPLTDKKGNPIPYSRCRYKNPQDPKRKYMQMKGTRVELWVTDPIRKAVERIKRHEDNAETVDLLVCVEGEKKAERLASFGIYAVGVPGINNYRWKSKLHPTLKNIIETLKPKALLDLKDSDYFFKSGNTEHEKDLATRCKTFKASVLSIHQACKEYEWMDVYTGHVHERFIDTYKGVDDLLNGEGIDTEKVIKELLHYYEGNSMSNERGSTEYIKCYPLSGINSDKIAHFLNADDSTTAQQYYDSHGRKDHLKNDVFTFRKKQWQADENGVVKEYKTEEEERRLTPRITQIINYLKKEGYEFRYNEALRKTEIKKGNDDNFKRLTDRDVNTIAVDLKERNFKTPKEDINDYLYSNKIKSYDPIKDYFENLEYKGDGFVKKYFDCLNLEKGESDTEDKEERSKIEKLFEKWLIACYRNGILKKTRTNNTFVNDVCFVLAGPQGCYKTSYIEHLFTTKEFGDDYYQPQNINLDSSNKETQAALIQKWAIMLDEMLNKANKIDLEDMKNIISLRKVSYREPFGRIAEEFPRRAIFAGAVNNKNFLRDSENRRFLCVEVESIKPEFRDMNIDEIWAEVKHKSDSIDSDDVYTDDDRRQIERISKGFQKQDEIAETLRSMFTPIIEQGKTTYILQYKDMLKAVTLGMDGNEPKKNELIIALQKCGFKYKKNRAKRFGTDKNGYALPKDSYKVQTVEGFNHEKIPQLWEWKDE